MKSVFKIDIEYLFIILIFWWLRMFYFLNNQPTVFFWQFKNQDYLNPKNELEYNQNGGYFDK